MKKIQNLLMLLICSIYSFEIFGQDFNDLIITKQHDTIKCKITLVNDQNIFYDYKAKKNKIKSEFISLEHVSSFKYSNSNQLSVQEYKEKELNQPKNDNIKAEVQVNEIQQAGELLQKFHKEYKYGWALMLVGTTVIALNPITGLATLGVLAGGALSISGFVTQFISFSRVGEAGERLVYYSKKNIPITN